MTPPFVDAEQIRRRADGGAYERGVAYFRDGAVRVRRVGSGIASVLESVVDGQRPDRLPMPHPPRPGPSRPADRLDLLHLPGGARLQAHRRHAAREQSARGSRRLADGPAGAAQPAAWRALLAPPSSRHRRRRPPSPSASSCASACGAAARSGRPTRVESASPRGLHLHGADVLVGLRPLERSARSDAWIKGAVSWEAVRRLGHPYEPAQARWFAELYSIARDMRLFGAFSDVVRVGHARRHRVPPALAAPGDGGRARHRRGADQEAHRPSPSPTTADVVVRAEQTPDGLALAARLSIDDEPVDADEVRPIGHIGIYRFQVRRDRIELTLAPVPLPAPVHALVTARAAVTVPVEDTPEFLTQHLPRLLRQVAVDAPGIALPAAERPVLVVTARFSPAHRLDFALRWRYGEREPVPYRAPLSDDRDAEAEDAIRDAGRSGLGGCRARRRSRHPGSCPGSTPPSSPPGCCPRSRRSPTSRSRSTGERPRYRELTADPHVTVSTVETTDRGLVRSRRHRDDRRAHDPVRPAVHRALAGAAQAAAQRRALLLARAPRRCSGCAT